MIRRMLVGVTAAWFALMLVIPARAAQSGTIQVSTRGGTVALYRVGEAEEDGFRLQDIYGGGTVTYEDALSPNLAAWLAERAKSGYVKAADLDGTVEFSNLEEGLYLLIQRSAPPGYGAFSPFLVSIPWDGQTWEIEANPKIPGEQPRTGDSFRLPLWITAMLLSAAGVAVCAWGGRKELRDI